eukprot:m.94741 g.94741  ORF g.94741 m.94741 type:complete len:348 (-) comp13870_c0_seq4:20-1063(-)
MPSKVDSMFDSIRAACATARANAAAIGTVNEEGIAAWAAALQNESEVTVDEPHSLPFRFDSFEQELNFLAIRNLLNFGSAYDKELEKATGKRAHETILFGIICMHISGKSMTSDEFLSLTLGDIEPLFNFPLSSETSTELSGVTMMVASPLRPFGEQLLAALQETSTILKTRGMQRLSQFVLHTVGAEGTRAADLTLALTSTFPAFRDVTPATEACPEIPFSGKAIAFVAELYHRFHATRPEFKFADHAALTPTCSPTVVALARRAGLLTLTEEAATQFDATTTVSPIDGPVRALTLSALEAAAAHLSATRGWVASPRGVESHLIRLAASPAMRDTHVAARSDSLAF